MGHWLRNPILHFVVIGGLLFTVSKRWPTLYGTRMSGLRRDPIVISAERIRQLQTDFARQGGIQPTNAQLQALIQEAVTSCSTAKPASLGLTSKTAASARASCKRCAP